MDGRRWLPRSPTGWFLLTLAEYLIAIALVRWLLPDGLPIWAGLPVFVGTIVGLLWLNLRLARRTRDDG
jgi:hypothetical protein